MPYATFIMHFRQFLDTFAICLMKGGEASWKGGMALWKGAWFNSFGAH